MQLQQTIQHDMIYKIILFGESGVGKTTLVQRILHDRFNNDLKSTIGVELCIKKTMYANKMVTLSIWDIAGQDRFKALLTNYCIGASAGILAFNINDINSVSNFEFWVRTIRERVPNIPILLVSTKADLGHHRLFSPPKLQILMTQWQLYNYVETSSKLGIGINDLIQRLCHKLVTVD